MMDEVTELDRLRDDLEKEAMRYARMKVFGHYVNPDGTIGIPCFSEVKGITDIYADNTLRIAVRMLEELSKGELPKRKKETK
jgi:hypothetical protein